jgi:hypothetical protein
MDSATRLQTILVDSPVGSVLPAIAFLNLPNWWLAGGAVRNTVWRSHFSIDFRPSDSRLSWFGTTVG